jgi:hypothetical protein
MDDFPGIFRQKRPAVQQSCFPEQAHCSFVITLSHSRKPIAGRIPEQPGINSDNPGIQPDAAVGNNYQITTDHLPEHLSEQSQFMVQILPNLGIGRAIANNPTEPVPMKILVHGTKKGREDSSPFL